MTTWTRHERTVRYTEWIIPANGLWGATYTEVLSAIHAAADLLATHVNGTTNGIPNTPSDDQIRVFPGDDEIIVRIVLPDVTKDA